MSLVPMEGTIVITAEAVARTLPWVIITPCKRSQGIRNVVSISNTENFLIIPK